MGFFQDFVDAANSNQPPPPSGVVRPIKRGLREDDVVGFMKAREDHIWDEINEVLRQASKHNPLRATQVRLEIRWLRKQAYKQGRPWGKK